MSKRKRSAFVAAAVSSRLKELEQEELAQALKEGYQTRQAEDIETNEEWEEATLQGWERPIPSRTVY